LLAACGDGSIVGGERRRAGPVNWWSRSRGKSEGAHGTAPGGQACCIASSSPATADCSESRRPHSLAPRRGGCASLGAPCAPAAPASKTGSSSNHVNHSRRESPLTLRPLSLLLLLFAAFAFFAPTDAQVPPVRSSPSPNTSHPGTTRPQPGLSPGCGCAHSPPLASLYEPTLPTRTSTFTYRAFSEDHFYQGVTLIWQPLHANRPFEHTNRPFEASSLSLFRSISGALPPRAPRDPHTLCLCLFRLTNVELPRLFPAPNF